MLYYQINTSYRSITIPAGKRSKNFKKVVDIHKNLIYTLGIN